MRNDWSIEVRLLSLPTVASLAAAHERSPDAQRELVVVRLIDGDANVGWGECSALNAPTYTDEWAAGAYDVLTSDDPLDAAIHPMASAALEMATLDLTLRVEGISLAGHLGASHARIPAGAVVGLGSESETLTAVEQLALAGYGRVKLKIIPDSLDIVRAIRHEFDEIELQVDGNGSFEAEAVDRLASIVEDADLDAVEQPFHPDDLDAAADLIERTDVPVLADEPIDGLDDAEEIFEQGALSGIVVKPPKVGGVNAALDIVDWANEVGLPLAAGGMLECGLGRHALAAVAAVDGFTITGDVSPAGRWLAEDPWPDLEMHDGWITVPAEPGVAPAPDIELLDRFTVRSWAENP